MRSKPCLVAFSGLSGTGKSTVARELTFLTMSVHLRIDTIEAALKRSSLQIHPAEDAGYAVGYAIAAENLEGSKLIIADSVNPITITRDAWAAVARVKGAQLVEVEIICSDDSEHRRRVEARESDINGHDLPTWQRVIERHYEPWQRQRIVIDTATIEPKAAAAMIQKAVE